MHASKVSVPLGRNFSVNFFTPRVASEFVSEWADVSNHGQQKFT